jgi:hypothetical protein
LIDMIDDADLMVDACSPEAAARCGAAKSEFS